MRAQSFFYLAVVICILSGIYFRFGALETNHVNDDEIYNQISAVKLNIDHSSYDPRFYNSEHPFLGKKIMGLFLSHDQNYSVIRNLDAFYAANHLAAPELRSEQQNFRNVTALFGILLLIPLFFLTRKIYGQNAALLSVALVSIWIGFINLSRVTFQDAILPFFLVSAAYFFVCFLEQKSNTKEGWKNTLYFVLSFLFLLFSFLIRVGQPIIFVIAFILAAFPLRKKLLPFLLTLPFLFVLIVLGYGLGPLQLMLENRGSQLLPLSPNAHWVIGLFDYSAYAFVALVGGLILLYFMYFTQHQRAFARSLKNTFTKSTPGKRVLYWITILTFASFLVTNTSSLVRIYLVLIIPLIIIVSGEFSTRLLEKKYVLVSFLLLLNVLVLFSAFPAFNSLSLSGQSPSYIRIPTLEHAQAFQFLENKTENKLYTNDPTLILEDTRFTPLLRIHAHIRWEKIPIFFIDHRIFTHSKRAGSCVPRLQPVRNSFNLYIQDRGKYTTKFTT